ncbi:hypothetical protein Bbelb_445010 [Branchiostoma belcheri]|nr:hypothetical protein Bbelb_445010 [Branchiostoma belcheri]
MAGSENEERPEARGKQVPPLRWCGKSSAFLAGVPGMFGTDHGVDLNSQKVHLRVTNSTSERNQPILATEGVPRSLKSAVMGRSFQQCDLEGLSVFDSSCSSRLLITGLEFFDCIFISENGETLYQGSDETVRRLECRNNVQWARVKRRVAGHQPRNDDPGRKACVNEVVLSDSKQVTLPRRVKGGAVRTDGSGDWGMSITHIKARFLAGEKDRESGTDTAQVRIYRPRPSLQRAGPRGQTVVLAGQAEFSPGKTGRKLPYTRPGEKDRRYTRQDGISGEDAGQRMYLTTASDLLKVFTLYPM